MSSPSRDKLCDRLDVAAEAAEEEAIQTVMASPRIEKHPAGREVVEKIVEPGELFNVVTRPSI